MGCAMSTPAEGADADPKAAAANGGAVDPQHPAAARVPATTRAAVKKIAFANRGKVQQVADEDLPHGESINRYIAAAKAELAAAENRCVWDYYSVHDKLLGRGGFARVFRSKCLATGDPVAIKVISRENPESFEMQEAALVTKIAAMRALAGHPAMLDLLELFVDQEGVHVVIEYLRGDALFDAILKRRKFSERDAADVMRQLLEFLAFSHAVGIVHRDIKPENLVIVADEDEELDGKAKSSSSGSQAGGDGEEGASAGDDRPPPLLKVIDFGSAAFCERGQRLHTKFGTANYCAPEVLECEYGPEADVWSAGVVLYTMLVGYPPFKARTDSGTLARVRAGNFSFERDGWAGVSAEAKDLISKMLTMDVSKRPSAAELLDHPWFDVAADYPGAGAAGGGAHHAPHAVGGEDYLARLSAYAHSSRMARLALKVIASSVSTEEAERLRRAFREADVDGDGRLTVKQLHSALKAVGVADEHAAADVDEFAEVCRADEHIAPPAAGVSAEDVGTVDYGEFLAALFDADRVIHTRPDVLLAAFEKLDVDHDGFIGPEDLQRALPGDASAEEAREAIRELLLEDDPEHVSDGKVSRAAFVSSLMHHHAEYHPSEGGGGTATGGGGGTTAGATTGGGGGGDTDGEGTGGGGTLAVPPGSGGAHRRPSVDRRRRSIDRRRAQVLAAEQRPSSPPPAPLPAGARPPSLPRPPSRTPSASAASPAPLLAAKRPAAPAAAVVNATAAGAE